jgi:hypothetical protein
MGCNCKGNKAPTPPPPQVVVNKEIVFVNPEPPPYSWEEVIAVKDYLNSFNKTEEGRLNMYNFNKKYFGEEMEGYCNPVCQERVKRRLERATELLQEWENTKK